MCNYKSISTTQVTDYVMSDDMALGLYDTDGSILIVIEPRQSSKIPFRINIIYYLGQSLSKKDTVEKIAEKFGGSVVVDANGVDIRTSSTSEVGKQIRLFFKKNTPLHPERRYSFLMSEEIMKLLDESVHTTKEGLVTLIHLAYNNKLNKVNTSRIIPIQAWIDRIKPSEQELQVGESKAKQIVKRIKNNIAFYEQQLPRLKLSLDYIRGAHFGDGGFTVGLTWKPNKSNRRRCEPEWTIAGENKFYCQAFVNTLGGSVNKSGPNCYKFRLCGIAKCQNIFDIFDEAPWMPEYKKVQFEAFQKAVQLLVNKQHFTKQGTIELLDLVYGISEKGTRSFNKEQYIEWGITWLINRGYIQN